MVISGHQLQPTLMPASRDLRFLQRCGLVNYEGVQADIFDHILAAIPNSNCVFRIPAGTT